MKGLTGLSIFIFVFAWYQSYTQNTFSFTLDDGFTKRSDAAFEDSNGNISALVSQWTDTPTTPPSYYRAGILTFSPTGDTNTIYYNLGDTVFSLKAMTKTKDEGFVLAGHAGQPQIGNSRMLLIKINKQKQRIWTKQHLIEGVLNYYPSKIIADTFGYYVFGAVDYTLYGPWYPFMSRFDNNGNLLRYYMYPDNAFREHEFVFNVANNRIWMFSGPTLDPFMGASKLVFDTTFNYISGEELPIDYMEVTSFKWSSDSTFYVSYLGYRNELPNSFNDHEFSLSLYDTTMNRLSYGEFGNLDSDDYPGIAMPYDFIHVDTIFYTGTIGLNTYPIIYGYKSWIMVGQTDKNLQERYRQYLGGDANYGAYYIVALKDGGCFVNAIKVNENLLVYDLVFFKLDQYGQLVYTSDPAMVQRRFLSYPNPVTDYITVEGPASGYEVQLFSQDGRLLDAVNAHTSKIQLKASNLKPGMYFLSFLIDGKKIETEKIIKH